MRAARNRPLALERVLALGALVAFFAAALLSWPREAAPPPLAAAVRVLVVDASASVRRPRPDWPTWARDVLHAEADAAERAGEEVALVVFANEVRRVLGPAAPERLRARLAGRDGPPLAPAEGAGDDDASRLRGALELALSLAFEPERARGRVVLVGADAATDGDPDPLLARLVGAGSLDVRPLPAPARADLGLVDLRLPPEVEAGAPLELTAAVRHVPAAGGGPTRGVLDLEVYEAGTQRLVRVPLELVGWNGRREVAVALGPALPGLTRVTAHARLEGERDPLPENDRATAVTSSRASRVLGVLTAGGAEPPTGAPAGLERVDLTPPELPELLASLDAVLAVDVSLEELEARVPAELLAAFVRGGGGWVATGGWSFLGGWTEGTSRRGLGALLPLEPAAPEGGPRDVVLLLDGSESMAGEPFEAVRQAAVELVAASSRSDRVVLHFFTRALQPAVLLKERGAPEEGRAAGVEAARRLLSRAVPRGATHLMHSVEQLLEERPPDAPPALVILLTDGRDMETVAVPIAQRGAELREAMRAQRVRLVPLAVGERVELRYLQALVPAGRPVQHVEDLADLGRVFRREVAGVQTVTAPPGEALQPAFVGTASGLAAAAVGTGAPPPLERFVRARARGEAEVAWAGPEGLPLLALGRVGRGRVAHVTTSLQAGWAAAWVDPAGRGAWELLGPLLRWAARRPDGLEPERPRATLEDRRLRVTGLPPSAAVELRAELVRAEARVPLVLRPPVRAAGDGAGALRERVAELPPDARDELLDGAASGTATLLVHADDGPGAEALPLPVALGPAPEFLGGVWWPDPELLAASSAAAGEAPEPTPRPRPHPLAPWAAAAGVLLLAGWAGSGLTAR